MAIRHFSHQRGPSASQGPEQAVRAQLGLTQQELAHLLGVSRAALAMAEQGSRVLPPAAAQRLAGLAQALATTAVPALATTALSATQRGLLARRLQAIKLEEQPLREQLSRVQIRLTQARLRQQAEPELRATLPAREALAHRWLSRLAEEADACLREESATPALLELRLDLLATEHTAIERLLAAG